MNRNQSQGKIKQNTNSDHLSFKNVFGKKVNKSVTPRSQNNEYNSNYEQSSSFLNLSRISNPSENSIQSDRSQSNHKSQNLLYNYMIMQDKLMKNNETESGPKKCCSFTKSQIQTLQNELLSNCTKSNQNIKIIRLEDFAKWFTNKLTYVSNSTLLQIRKNMKEAFSMVDIDDSKTIEIEEFQQLISYVIQYYKIQLIIKKYQNFRLTTIQFSKDKELQLFIEGNTVDEKLKNFNFKSISEQDYIDQGMFLSQGTKYQKGVSISNQKDDFANLNKIDQSSDDKTIKITIEDSNKLKSNEIQDSLIDENNETTNQEIDLKLNKNLNKNNQFEQDTINSYIKYEKLEENEDISKMKSIIQMNKEKVKTSNFKINELNHLLNEIACQNEIQKREIDKLKFGNIQFKNHEKEHIDKINILSNTIADKNEEIVKLKNEISSFDKKFEIMDNNYDKQLKNCSSIRELKNQIDQKNKYISSLEEKQYSSEQNVNNNNLIIENQKNELNLIKKINNNILEAKNSYKQINQFIKNNCRMKSQIDIESQNIDKNIKFEQEYTYISILINKINMIKNYNLKFDNLFSQNRISKRTEIMILDKIYSYNQEKNLSNNIAININKKIRNKDQSYFNATKNKLSDKNKYYYQNAQHSKTRQSSKLNLFNYITSHQTKTTQIIKNSSNLKNMSFERTPISQNYESKYNSEIKNELKELNQKQQTFNNFSFFGQQFDCNFCERIDDKIFEDQ